VGLEALRGDGPWVPFEGLGNKVNPTHNPWFAKNIRPLYWKGEMKSSGGIFVIVYRSGIKGRTDPITKRPGH